MYAILIFVNAHAGYYTVGWFLIASIITGVGNINLHIYYYGTGSTFAIIEFIICPDLPKMQSLNHAIKTHPRVLRVSQAMKQQSELKWPNKIKVLCMTGAYFLIL